MLDGAVNGHHQTLATAAGKKAQDAVIKLCARYLPPMRETNAIAGQEVPIVPLDAQHRHPLGIEKSQNLAGQRSLWVEAPGMGCDVDMLQQKILVSQSPLAFGQQQLALFKIDLRRDDQVVSVAAFRQQVFYLKWRGADPLREPLRNRAVVIC